MASKQVVNCKYLHFYRLCGAAVKKTPRGRLLAVYTAGSGQIGPPGVSGPQGCVILGNIKDILKITEPRTLLTTLSAKSGGVQSGPTLLYLLVINVKYCNAVDNTASLFNPVTTEYLPKFNLHKC